jgi:hypothetical protein
LPNGDLQAGFSLSSERSFQNLKGEQNGVPSKSSGPPPQVDKAPGEVAFDTGEILMGELENCSDWGVKTKTIQICDCHSILPC